MNREGDSAQTRRAQVCHGYDSVLGESLRIHTKHAPGWAWVSSLHFAGPPGGQSLQAYLGGGQQTVTDPQWSGDLPLTCMLGLILRGDHTLWPHLSVDNTIPAVARKALQKCEGRQEAVACKPSICWQCCCFYIGTFTPWFDLQFWAQVIHYSLLFSFLPARRDITRWKIVQQVSRVGEGIHVNRQTDWIRFLVLIIRTLDCMYSSAFSDTTKHRSSFGEPDMHTAMCAETSLD